MNADVFFREIFPSLKSFWGGEIQDLYQFDNPRSRNVLNNLDFLSGCRVLDIGCNSGIYSLSLGATAEFVYGIDTSQQCIALAQGGKQFFQQNVFDVSNVHFHRQPLQALAIDNLKVDAVLACNVLYHLTDAEIRIAQTILRNSRKAFFQMRPRRQLAYERNKDSFFFVSRNSICSGLYTVGHAIEFLQDLGFSRFAVRGEENYWADEPFPLVLAERV